MRIILAIILLYISTEAYGQTTIIQQTPPQIYVTTIPSVTHTTYAQPQIYFTHGWVPYLINTPVIVEQRGLFCKTRSVIYQERIEWLYQPVYQWQIR